MIDFLVAMQSAVISRVKRTKDVGATAVEYGLMVALIAGVIIVAVTALGQNVNHSFDKTCGAISSPQSTTCVVPAAP